MIHENFFQIQASSSFPILREHGLFHMWVTLPVRQPSHDKLSYPSHTLAKCVLQNNNKMHATINTFDTLS
jgi:hypothetical protein